MDLNVGEWFVVGTAVLFGIVVIALDWFRKD
jgi:hypothetical protein